jgi:hypothetical protein
MAIVLWLVQWSLPTNGYVSQYDTSKNRCIKVGQILRTFLLFPSPCNFIDESKFTRLRCGPPFLFYYTTSFGLTGHHEVYKMVELRNMQFCSASRCLLFGYVLPCRCYFTVYLRVRRVVCSYSDRF